MSSFSMTIRANDFTLFNLTFNFTTVIIIDQYCDGVFFVPEMVKMHHIIWIRSTTVGAWTLF